MTTLRLHIESVSLAGELPYNQRSQRSVLWAAELGAVMTAWGAGVVTVGGQIRKLTANLMVVGKLNQLN